MNPTRAASFEHSARVPLQRDVGWPRLPAGIILDRAVGVGLDSRNFIYVAHRGRNPLLCLNPDGSLCREIAPGAHRATVAYDVRGPVPVPMASRVWLHGLHVDPWDHVWVTDVSRHLVMKFSPEGRLLLTLGVDGEAGNDARHFAQPTHVCVVPSGDFFVADGYGNSRIVKFQADGERLLEWGRRGNAPGEFHTPHVITLGQDGLLYVSDRENDRIQIFDQDGALCGVWPGLHGIDGLFAARDGLVYASVGVDRAVLRFDYSGRKVDVWVAPDLVRYPHAIAVGGDGALYVADSGDVWSVDPATRHRPRREYRLEPRLGAEGSALTKLRVASQ